MAGKRPTAAEKAIRINKVESYIITGMDRGEIWQYVSNPEGKGFIDVSIRTLDRYLAAAKDRIEKLSETNREYEIGQAKKRLDLLFKRNLSIQDYKAALGVIRERSKLLGLNEPEKHDIHQEIDAHIDPDELDRSILALSETLGDILSRSMDPEQSPLDPPE